MKPSTPAAIAALTDAASHVEMATADLDHAVQKLSHVHGGSELYDRARDLLSQVAQFNSWLKGSRVRPGMRLDTEDP